MTCRDHLVNLNDQDYIVQMNEILPDLDLLRTFVVAATTLNFRHASERVHCSPAALSARIQTLEEQLSATLFERSTRHVALTPAGQRLLPVALQCLETARACKEAVREGAGELSLRVGTRFELGLSWLVPNLDRLRLARPERTLHLVFGDSPDLLARLRRDELEAVVTSYRLPSPDLVGVPLHSEEYVFVGAPGVLPKGGVTGPLSVVGMTLIDASAELPLFRYLLDARGEPLWPFLRVEQQGAIAAIRLRVLAGAGLAVLPRYFVEADLESGRLVELLPGTPMVSDQFRLVWRAGHPAAAALLGLARELALLPLC